MQPSGVLESHRSCRCIEHLSCNGPTILNHHDEDRGAAYGAVHGVVHDDLVHREVHDEVRGGVRDDLVYGEARGEAHYGLVRGEVHDDLDHREVRGETHYGQVRGEVRDVVRGAVHDVVHDGLVRDEVHGAAHDDLGLGEDGHRGDRGFFAVHDVYDDYDGDAHHRVGEDVYDCGADYGLGACDADYGFGVHAHVHESDDARDEDYALGGRGARRAEAEMCCPNFVQPSERRRRDCPRCIDPRLVEPPIHRLDTHELGGDRICYLPTFCKLTHYSLNQQYRSSPSHS